MKKYRIKIVGDVFYPQYKRFLFWEYFSEVKYKATNICSATVYEDVWFDSEEKCISYINKQKLKTIVKYIYL